MIYFIISNILLMLYVIMRIGCGGVAYQVTMETTSRDIYDNHVED